MKNVYELTSKEKDKFKEQFNETSFAKTNNQLRLLTLLAAMAGVVVSGTMAFLVEDGYKIQETLSIIKGGTAFSFAIFIILTLYGSISFNRWLKIKHKIDY